MFVVPRNPRNFKTRRENPTERDFIQMYRFSVENVQWLTQHFLGEEDDETRGGAVNSFSKMKILLRYIADPGK
jgi:hypothetical protein